MSADPSSKTYTVAEIAERLGVSCDTVSGWIRAGELRAVNVSRSARSKKPRYRVSAEALAEFERARTPMPAQPRAKPRRRSDQTRKYFV